MTRSIVASLSFVVVTVLSCAHAGTGATASAPPTAAGPRAAKVDGASSIQPLLVVDFEDGARQGGSLDLCRRKESGVEPTVAGPGLRGSRYALHFGDRKQAPPQKGDRWQLAWRLPHPVNGDVTVRAIVKTVRAGRGVAFNLRASDRSNVAKVGLGFGEAGFVSVHAQPDKHRTTSLAYRDGKEGILEFAYLAATGDIRVRYNGVEDTGRRWVARASGVTVEYLEIDNEVGGPGIVDDIEVLAGIFPAAARQPELAAPGDGLAGAATVDLYDMIERTFVSDRTWAKGYLGPEVDVVFTHADDPSATVTLPAFWNGRDSAGHERLTVRFAPTRLGAWTYRTRSKQDPSLDGLQGPSGKPEVIQAVPSKNPGFLRRSDTFHWRFSNGTRFFPVGTTAYEWIGSPTAEGPALDHTIEFIKKYFNKVRLSFMSTRLADNAFGGERRLSDTLENGEYWYSDVSQVDSTVLNLDHWARLDRLVGKLQQAGIQVELIFARKVTASSQVQGDWLRGVAGRPGAGHLIQDKAIRYVVGRYAALSSIWWCIANEFPEPGLTKDDISRIGRRFKELDPYGHPLSVHWNSGWLFGGEDWATHGTLQKHLNEGGLAKLNANVAKLRQQHGIVFHNEEYGYEDRVRTPNTPENVVKAHWALVLGGGYGGYGHSPSRLQGKYMWAGMDRYWERPGLVASPPRSAEEAAAGQEAAPALATMRDFMNSGDVGYWRMAPANNLVAGDAKDAFCLAAEGHEYLASGEGGKLRIDLRAAGGKDLAVVELDPFTGAQRRLASTKGAVAYEHAIPSGRFVLVHIGSSRN